MAYLEYPKIVRKGDDEKTVGNKAEEDAAVADGYVPPPPPPPETDAQRKASPAYLEYPKLLYLLDGGDPVRVNNADEEAAISGVSVTIAEPEDTANEPSKPKRGRPAKS